MGEIIKRNYHPWVILGSSFIFKIILLQAFPALYGNDTVGRILHKDDIFFSYWLPAFQILIYGIGQITTELFILRYFLIVISTLASAVVYLTMKAMAGPRIASYTLLFFSFSPISVYLSLVPYQEMLFIIFALLSLYFYFKGRSLKNLALTSLCLNSSSFTRYEGWILSFIFLLLYSKDAAIDSIKGGGVLLHPRPTPFILAKGILLFFWGPISLLLIGHYTHPEQNDSLITWSGLNTSISYILFYFSKLVIWVNPIILTFILARVWTDKRLSFIRQDVRNPKLWNAILWFVLSYIIFLILFVADGTRYNMRFVFVPSLLISMMAGMSFHYVQSQIILPRLLKGILIGLFALVILGTPTFAIWKATHPVEVNTPYEIALFIDQHLLPQKSALIVSDFWPDYPEAEPPEYMRVTAQTRRDKEYIVSSTALYGASDPELYLKQHNIQYVIEFASGAKSEDPVFKFREYIRTHPDYLVEVRSWSNARIYENRFKKDLEVKTQ
ncbi:MAG: hypothetical protein HYR76_13415 [Ignavibacteria bacterium]|nr:hypothetical protein [Ignavibacteria bacterium]MBI3766004.1 hypothetical protein [Ignavibacteriales bacterium]